MQKYTLGYIFDPQLSRVVLIEKKRPEWQEGKLNGIGGKVEAGETALACMSRETREETGLSVDGNDWATIATLKGSDWNVEVFAATYRGAESDVVTLTDEKVAWYDIVAIPENRLSNIVWHIELAKDRLANKQIHEVTVNYD